ncbi:maleylacetate reductase [Streptomyces sp. NPDC057257]|uniref:maleylacetate reductase n=1 Tax=Streptomyces sp. NPDC057257 TaxID=3346071 RepID=UPI003626D610
MVPHFTYRPSPVEVRFAPGGAGPGLRAALREHGVGRPLVITTPSRLELAADLVGDGVTYFTDVAEHVPRAIADAAVERARQVRADALVAIGGGSATGTAKAVAVETGLPVLAVPTTFSGSEVTPVWGITDATGKHTGTDPRVLPRCVIYDPDLAKSLPPALAKTSAMNALAHAVEGFWAPGTNPVTRIHAMAAIRLIVAGLATFDGPADRAGDFDGLLFGAYLAGTVFADTGSGLHHRVCHVLGGSFGLPHAPTHAVVLPHVLALNSPYLPAESAAMATVFDEGEGDATGGLANLSRRLGIPGSLAELGMKESDLDEAARLVAKRIPRGNPAPVDEQTIRRLLGDAHHGTC